MNSSRSVYSTDWEAKAIADTMIDIADELEELLKQLHGATNQYAVVLRHKSEDELPKQLYSSPGRARRAAWDKNICRPDVRPAEGQYYELRTYETRLVKQEEV